MTIKIERLKNLPLSLFYLLILFLPTQFGRHFFFDFSLVGGINSDYLTPTLYFTDIIIVFLIVSVFKVYGSPIKSGMTRRRIFLYIIFYLLFTSLFIADSKYAALYKTIKVAEFILLGISIVKIKPKLSTTVFFLSFGVIFESVIAIWQFIVQRSIGGFFWYLGERTFYAGTPGIAAINWAGKLIMRPYGTFPHPNVLGGFLAVVLPAIIYSVAVSRKHIGKYVSIIMVVAILVGFPVLILTFSRSAWIAGIAGLILILNRKIFKDKIFTKKNFILFTFYLLIVFSVMVPLIVSRFGILSRNILERKDLIEKTITIVIYSPVFGVGPNNILVHLYELFTPVSGMYAFQPVHNIYLLVLAETGIIGLACLLIFSIRSLDRSIKKSYALTVLLLGLLFLGMFDHYLFTLQQGQLLFTVFFSFAFVPGLALK